MATGVTQMETAIVLFTRDLRLHHNPALHQACSRARQVVPLFVRDPAITAPPNRARFLAQRFDPAGDYVRAATSPNCPACSGPPFIPRGGWTPEPAAASATPPPSSN